MELFKKLLIFQDGTLLVRIMKKTHSKKVYYISGNETF